VRHYLDTNALVKSLVVEDGTDLMSEVRATSLIATPSVASTRSTLQRHWRSPGMTW